MEDSTGQKRDEVVRRQDDLEIEENMQAQRRLWKFQRVGRGVALLILVLSVAGVFGRGPLSSHVLESGGSSVAYERIAHRDAPQVLRFKVPLRLAEAGKLQLVIGSETFSRLRLEQIVPEPSTAMLGPHGTVFLFDVTTAPASGGHVELSFALEATQVGLHEEHFSIANGPTLALSQLVLP